MSGHITRMSRGSRVGSSASRPSSTSRSTSTCRATPWQACTWTDRSSGAYDAPRGSRGVGAEVVLEPAEQGRRRPAGACGSSPSRRSSARRRQRPLQLAGVAPEASRAAGGRPAGGLSSARRATGAARRPRALATGVGDGCGSQTWTSRARPRARRAARSRWPTAGCGRTATAASGRSKASGSSRQPGDGVALALERRGAATRSTSRRHSSGCQARSPARARRRRRCRGRRTSRRPASAAGRRTTRRGRPAAGRRRSAGRAAGRPPRRCGRGRGGAPGCAAHGSSRHGVDHVEQRPGQRVGRPRVVVAGAGDLGDQRPR